MSKIGLLGEQFVAQWLIAQSWHLLHHRWRCRWGEIDLIVHHPINNILAFVEVKTRRRYNWDENGLLAITPQKQEKLSVTAAYFLAEYPDYAQMTCRFDVALVSYCQGLPSSPDLPAMIQLGQPIFWQGYQFRLHRYLPSAFETQ